LTAGVGRLCQFLCGLSQGLGGFLASRGVTLLGLLLRLDGFLGMLGGLRCCLLGRGGRLGRRLRLTGLARVRLAGLGLALPGIGLPCVGLTGVGLAGIWFAGIWFTRIGLCRVRLARVGLRGFATQRLLRLGQGVFRLLLLAGGLVGLTGGLRLGRLICGCFRLLQVLLGGVGPMGQFLIALGGRLFLKLLRCCLGLFGFLGNVLLRLGCLLGCLGALLRLLQGLGIGLRRLGKGRLFLS